MVHGTYYQSTSMVHILEFYRQASFLEIGENDAESKLWI
jgi:hypothetical protein